MNERILELARQVWPDPNISHVNHMKFAELIVRECVDQILSQWIKDNKGVDPANLSDGATYLAGAVCRVKEHFGVE